jgi:Protein of unknown function (DUF3048) N-terminal domain/Protein of unknown function (DUF3048) C-terminal domain
MSKVKCLVMAGLIATTVLAAAGPKASASVADGRVPAGGVLRVKVPEAIGGKTVIGQLTADRVRDIGYVTAYGCADGMPSRSDLNYVGTVSPVASNRLIVKADNNGEVCFYTLRAAALIVDVNAVTFDTGIESFTNRRTDSRDNPAGDRVTAGGVLRVNVPEAIGGKTVIGQLTADRVRDIGYVTAYGCADGMANRSDVNYVGTVLPVASNRLIVKADNNGDLCFATLRPAALIVDINGLADVGIRSFPNRRTDTRDNPAGDRIPAGGVLRVNVPDAIGGKTVIGQLTADRVRDIGYVTAYGCADGMPNRSDLNYVGTVSPVASNRLIVKADDNGDVCFATSQPAALIVDINGVSAVGISSFPNHRTDTRDGPGAPGAITVEDVPVWPAYAVKPPIDGVAALTGLPADSTVAKRPILAVKIDNYSIARPQWGLDSADAIIEENVEGVTRFVGLFQTQLPSEVGPVRSARTADLDLLVAMNHPVFAFSGANDTVNAWVDSAATSGLLTNFTALSSPCYVRTAERPGPHNLLLDGTCAVTAATGTGPARPLWPISATWTRPATASSDTTFSVPMDGVDVSWTWDVATGTYQRWSDGKPHLTVSGAQLSARTVVEVDCDHIPSPADARSPNPITTGSGTGVVHRTGVAVPVVWSRPTAYDPFTFVDAATRVPVPLDTGRSFLELVRA